MNGVQKRRRRVFDARARTHTQVLQKKVRPALFFEFFYFRNHVLLLLLLLLLLLRLLTWPSL